MGSKLSEMTLEELWQLFPIILTPYNPQWPEWYREQQNVLRQTMPMEQVVRIAHIGSTAIGTIWAKPTVDILVEVKKDSDLVQISDLLAGCGYTLMSQGENRRSFNKGYTENGFAEKVFHLHLRMEGDHDELYFRDYLRQFPRKAAEYEALKRRLQVKYTHDRDADTQAKGSFIKSTTALARKHFGAKYKPGAAQGQATRIE